jgi:glycine betaine/choline ABC-type transport system substrate-binding protein
LYEAVKVKQVDISVENTTRALHQLNRQSEADARKAYELVKAAYEKEMGLIWLRPLGFLNGNGGAGTSHTAVLVRSEVINNFPVLPRVIDKLGNVITDETYRKLVASVDSGEKSKKVARDFLKSKKLI